METLRKYGYDILINHYEPFLREFLINQVLLKNYSENWKVYIPNKIEYRLKEDRGVDLSTLEIHDFFQELLFSDLKSILIYNENYKFSKELVEDLQREVFILLMNELNRIRIKVAHVNENFTQTDLENIKNDIKTICRGDAGKTIVEFIDEDLYKEKENVDSIKIVVPEDKCKNNLPPSDYDLDGGFVGRKKEIKNIKKRIYSDLDRIITITGAGGVGKTALALEIAKAILDDPENPFEAIVWFSAKEKRLTDVAIVPIEPDIKDLDQLINNILEIIDKDAYENYQQIEVPIEYCIKFLYKRFQESKSLLIIDNLETILEQEPLIKFIEDVPSKVFITSRWGLGKLERPIALTELTEKDSIDLFRLVVKTRGIESLSNLSDQEINRLVNRVKRYPLALKWAIGQFILGKPIDESFPKEIPGDSLIAQFSFDDIFSMLKENERLVLYSTIVWNEPVSREMLKYLTELEEEELNSTIRTLMLTSFIFLTELNTKYSLLSLTSGFINTKLDEDKKIRVMLQNRKYQLSKLIEGEEKLRSSRYSLIDSLGIKTPEEKIAFEYVKQAKELHLIKNNVEGAKKLYEKAQSLAPNLGYVYEEYSKFAFYTKNDHNKAIALARKSIEVEPENFHLWFNYGIMLRKTDRVQKSIEIFKKALELNPKYMTTMMELGRSYTFIGDYEEANNQLIAAQKRAQIRNPRFFIKILGFRIDNINRWAKDLIYIKKFDEALIILNGAEDFAQETLELDPNDKIIHYNYRELHFTLGLLYQELGEHEESVNHFELSIGEIAGEGGLGNRREIFARSFYHLAIIKEKLEGFSRDEILELVNKGLAECRKDSEIFKKLLILNNRIVKTDTTRIIGEIIYFNVEKKYGFIKSDNKEYFFYIRDFLKELSPSSMINSTGKKVSFNVLEAKKEGQKDIAMNIDFIRDKT